MKDCTVSLHGRLYEVDAVLVGQTVTLRYDSDAPPSRPIEVVHDAQPAGVATRALERQGLLIRDDEAPSLDLEPDDGFEQLLGAGSKSRHLDRDMSALARTSNPTTTTLILP